MTGSFTLVYTQQSHVHYVHQKVCTKLSMILQLKKYMYLNVCSSICSNQNWKLPDSSMVKDFVYSYTVGILNSNDNGRPTNTYSHMDGSHKLNVEQNKSDTKICILSC